MAGRTIATNLPATLTVLAAASIAIAQPRYDLRLLPTLGGPDSRALALNSRGMIVGDSKIPDHNYDVATAWVDLQPIFLGGSGGSVAQASGINDAGVAVGVRDDPQGAFAIDLPTGPARRLPPLTDRFSAAWCINARGDIGGAWSTVTQQGTRPFIIRAGVLTDLPVLGGTQGLVTALSNAGHIVGWTEFSDATGQPAPVRWVNDAPQRLPGLGGDAWVNDVNDAGVMVGMAAPPGFGAATAALWTPHGDLMPLGSLNPAHWRHEAFAINNAGQAVGTSAQRAFLWQSGVMLDLNALTTPPPGFTLVEARDITDTGLIVGVGTLSGHFRGFLLLPACTADFNHDGDTGTDRDIEAFFACLAGDCCPTCGTADFNGDGDSDTDGDIEAFFRVLAGGAC